MTSKPLQFKIFSSREKQSHMYALGITQVRAVNWDMTSCNSAQSYVGAWCGGEFGGERIYVYAWLTPSL